MDHLCFLCLVFLMLSRLLVAALWSPAGKGLSSWLLLMMFIIFLLPFKIPGQLRDELQWEEEGICFQGKIGLFIANCATEFETVFRSLIIWRILFILPIAPNEKNCQIQVFYINVLVI